MTHDVTKISILTKFCQNASQAKKIYSLRKDEDLINSIQKVPEYYLCAQQSIVIFNVFIIKIIKVNKYVEAHFCAAVFFLKKMSVYHQQRNVAEYSCLRSKRLSLLMHFSCFYLYNFLTLKMLARPKFFKPIVLYRKEFEVLLTMTFVRVRLPSI